MKEPLGLARVATGEKKQVTAGVTRRNDLRTEVVTAPAVTTDAVVATVQVAGTMGAMAPVARATLAGTT